MSDVTQTQVPTIVVENEDTESFEPWDKPESPLMEVDPDNTTLFDKIHDLAKDHDGTETAFIPENSLKALFKDPHARLKADVVSHHIEDLDPDDVVEFICERAPKVYATLVFSQVGRLIMHFFKNDVDDSLLPVVREKGRVLSFPAQARLILADEAVKLANQNTSNLESIARTSPIGTDMSRLEKAKEDAQVARLEAEEARKAFRVAFNKVNRTFHPWGSQDRHNFCDVHQWFFMAPVFHETQFIYKFHDKAQMPFWPSGFKPKTGNFSSVTRRQIDRNHLPQNDNQTLVSTDASHPWVAEKKLIRAETQTDQDFELSYQLEANVLKVMKSLNDRHLIRTVASYRTNRDHYFMFPWADLGNLRDYWAKTNKVDPFNLKKRLAPPYLQWVFTQLHGVAHAIKLLHDLVILHGDLKPENILCFPNSGNKSEDDPCTLVIADAGLSKIHNLATHLRNQKTDGPKGSTVAYEPPEAEIQSEARTSRRYDVWSMGCICLEFLVWLVEGQKGLNDFHRGLAPFRGSFYELIYDDKDKERAIDAELHFDVVNKIKSLRNRPYFQGEDNPLGRLVDIIDKQMLVPRLHPVSTKDPASKKAGTLNVPQPMTAANRVMTMNASELPPGVRVTSDTMFYEFVKILRKKDSFKIPSAALDGSEDVLPSTTPKPENPGLGEGLGASGASGAAASSKSSSGLRVSLLETLGLDDNWAYDADTEFPANEIDWTADLNPSTIPSDLCHRCDAMRLWMPTCSFSDTLDGLIDKGSTCVLCRLLAQCMIDRIDRNDETIYFFRVMSYITFDDKRSQPILSLYTFPGAPSLAEYGIQTGLPKLPGAVSPSHTQILRKWISLCDVSHPCFPQDLDFVPTRLLSVGGSDSESIRLVEESTGDSSPKRYLALSHRWGSPELHGTFCTYTHNVMQFEQGIRVGDLPRTFHDAVQVTRSLGLRYLWIDSLCIIQDDPEDWNKESKLMEQVFSSAYVTISAISSSGTTDGFLKPRPNRQCVTAKLPGDSGALYYLCEAVDDFHLDVDESELSKRAWVLQERALSRRTIYFSQTQSYWECGRGVRCETLTKMNNQRASFLGDSDFPHSVDAFVKGMKMELYQGLYERFSNLQITFPGDRPAAIKGLETRLTRTFNTMGGLGIFNIYLNRCLLWKRSGKFLERIAVFHGQKVPSWSWMAYMGGINYLEVPYGTVKWEEDVVSPYKAGGASGPEDEDKNQGGIPRIEAVAWDFANPATILTVGDQEGPRRVILDNLGSDKVRHAADGRLKCVIIGKSKRVSRDGGQAHFVLIIGTVILEDGHTKAWERYGVGILKGTDISLEGSKTKVFIQ